MSDFSPLNRALLAEWLGTALLLVTVIGSGIMGERLAGGNTAIALLANTCATVAILFVLIEMFGQISGAHFNPAVSFIMMLRAQLPASHFLAYLPAQLLGAVCGAWLAHAMFDLPVFQVANKLRDGPGQWLAEMVATAGLVLVILRSPASKVSATVAAYIGAAYWFTASTSFANPAAVMGRMLSDTFAGIAPSSALYFVMAQVIGAGIGWALASALKPVATTNG